MKNEVGHVQVKEWGVGGGKGVSGAEMGRRVGGGDSVRGAENGVEGRGW